MIYTTLNKIRAHSPCAESWAKLLKALGKTKADDARLSFARIEKVLGFDDALWAARACPEHNKEWRLLAVAYARQVERWMTDPRALLALDTAERHAHGQATDAELAAARGAAWGAAEAAAWAAAEAAAEAARGAAGTAAWGAAPTAAWGAAWGAAWTAARAEQRPMFLAVVGTARVARRAGGAPCLVSCTTATAA